MKKTDGLRAATEVESKSETPEQWEWDGGCPYCGSPDYQEVDETSFGNFEYKCDDCGKLFTAYAVWYVDVYANESGEIPLTPLRC